MDYAEYYELRYTFREAALAAAFPLNTLRSNYQRGLFRPLGKRFVSRRGRARKLCLGDILVLAIASRLIDQGEGPLNAYNAAVSFGLVGSTPKALKDQGYPLRRPFELFDRTKFYTYLLWRHGSAARVIPVENGGLVPVDRGLDDEDKQFGVATTVVPLNAVENTVFKRLGLPTPESFGDT